MSFQHLLHCKRRAIKEIDLLHGITGAIKPGQLTALMGPSGAGKSTLLDVIAGRKNTGTITGDLLFNGQVRGHDFKRQCGYVEQRDVLLPTLTVRELLYYSAKLRMHASTSDADVYARVDTVIEQLELVGCKDVIIGSPSQRGISGGQAKRVNIGIELVTEPAILFLDEPTSGLDSNTALDIIRVVRKICDNGTTVVATIHQPSTDIYHLFDRLLLLVRGKIVYSGNADEAVAFFQNMGYEYPLYMNPADFVIAVTSDSTSSYRLVNGPTLSPEEFAENYAKSALAETRLISKKAAVDYARRPSMVLRPEQPLFVNTSSFNLRTLLRRQFTKCLRDPTFFKSRLILPFFVALVFLLVYLHSPLNEQGLRNRSSLIFLSIIFMTVGANSMIGPLIEDRLFFTRERNAGTYQVSAYYFSTVIFEMPYVIIKGLLWSNLVYWAPGFDDTAQKFFFFALVIIILADIGVSMAQLFAALCPTHDTASAAMTTLPTVFFLFSGFFIPMDSIPRPWIWMYYMSYANYGSAALLINELYDNDMYTTTAQLCPGNTCGAVGSSCITENVPVPGDTLMTSLGIADGFFHSRFANLLLLGIIWFCIRVLGYIVLRFVKHGSR